MRRGRVGLASVVLCALGLAGCATSSPSRQDYVSVETANFQILSALGEAQTRELTERLELFHAGVLAVLDLERTPPRFARTRVLAFDDRSLGRPFAVRGTPAYYLPGVDGGILVLRVPGGWNERITRRVRADYAHRLLRSRSLHRLPLWVAEGLAQVASAIQIEDGAFRLGALIQEHVLEVRDWHRSSLAGVLQRTDLSEASDAERERFEALSWALAHALMFDASDRRQGARRFPKAYLQTFDEAASGEGRKAADALLGGDGTELASLIHDHMDESRYALRILRPVGWDPQSQEQRPASSVQAGIALGDLALALDRAGLAASQFERALAQDSGNARALAGLALARADRFEEAEPLARRALASAAGDARVHLLVGRLYARAAAAAEEAGARGARRAEARRQLRASLEADPSSAAARLELGLGYLAAEEEAATGLEWLRSAAALRPGSLEVDLAIARLQARSGHRAAARYQARDVVSRARWKPLRAEAEEFLEELERRER